SDKQKKEMAEIQKDADAKLDKILNDEQKKSFKQMRDGKGPGPGGFGPPPGGGGGPGGLFRAPRYETKYPGLARDLKPGKTLEELLAKTAPKDKKETKDKTESKDKK